MKDKPYTERTGGSYVDEGGELRKVEGPDLKPAEAPPPPANGETPKKGSK